MFSDLQTQASVGRTVAFRKASGDGFIPLSNEALRAGRANFRDRNGDNAGRRRTRGIAFEDIAFHIERGDLLDILEHRTLTATLGSAFSSSNVTIACTWCRSLRMSTLSS